MDKKAFLKFCTNIFEENGFYRKGSSFYLDYNEDTLVVFSFVKSAYGAYYYIEYGLVFKAINRHLPFPKYNELDINFERLMTKKGKAIMYEVMTEVECDELSGTLQENINHILSIVAGGKESIARQCIEKDIAEVAYVLKGTPEYLGLNADLFKSKGIAVIDY